MPGWPALATLLLRSQRHTVRQGYRQLALPTCSSCQTQIRPIVIKTFVKPDPSMSLKSLVKHIRIERESLADVPNVLTYQKVVETERAGYLIRQWLHSNLYDRISTRPFLSSVEKRWITYQLLHAMRDAHERNIAHGDLKCENILVTTSLMIYVTDFASSFKPTYLPLDDPSDFSFFFDTSAGGHAILHRNASTRLDPTMHRGRQHRMEEITMHLIVSAASRLTYSAG